MSINIIHITGAAGAGTTTLGKAMSEKFGHLHFDTDDFFWEQTDPPFTQKREIEKRQEQLKRAMDRAQKCVISGSLTEWGDVFIHRFDLVIYVFAPTEIRLKRLQEREFQRFGNRILPDGDMFEEHQAFIKWAGQYDTGGVDICSALHHQQWLKHVACPVVRVDGTASIEAMLQAIDV